MPGEGMIFASVDEMQFALEEKLITLHSKIKIRLPYYLDDSKVSYKIVETCVGRALLSQLLPKNSKISFDLINQNINFKRNW